MAKSTVQKTESTIKSDDGDERTVTQYTTTIPKQVAEFMELEKGDELEWSIGSSRDKLEVTIKGDN